MVGNDGNVAEYSQAGVESVRSELTWVRERGLCSSMVLLFEGKENCIANRRILREAVRDHVVSAVWLSSVPQQEGQT